MSYKVSTATKRFRRRRKPFVSTNPVYHFGLGEPKPLRGFPEGEPVLFMSSVHFTRVQILLPEPPEPPEQPRPARRPFLSRWAAPPCTDPSCREFFVKLSEDGEFWEPGEEITPAPLYPNQNTTTP